MALSLEKAVSYALALEWRRVRNFWFIALALAATLMVPTQAAAQDELCAGKYSHSEWDEDMDGVDKNFADFKLEAADMALKEVRKLVPCLDEVLLPSHLGRYARQWALLAFFNQDEVTAGRWGLLQVHAAPNLPWPEEFGEEHPLREMISYAEMPVVRGPENKALLTPKKGAIFMNGWPLLVAEAPVDFPHLVQLTDKDGAVLIGYWQDGASFRDDTLGAPDETPEATVPKWFVPEPGMRDEEPAVAEVEPEPVEPEPEPEPEPKAPKEPKEPREGGLRTGNLLAGTGLAVVAGSLYAVGGLSRGALDDAESTPELAAARSKVNILAMSAGVAAVGAVGIGVTAFVGADGGHVGLNLRF